MPSAPDALCAWKRQRQGQAVAIEELQRLWRDGVDSGDSTPLDGEAIKRRGRERLAKLAAERR
jgi:Arc/MetJ-type ribon-helix-helix transcriptional regulator